MAVHGYVTHAAYNRRLTVALAAAYVVAFEVIAVFCLTWFLLIWDHEHTVLSNPAGYALRYAVPVALVTGLVFWWLYRGHADAVARSLDVRLVERAQEPRFVAIAEEQCTALGVRLPRFGIIEADEPNALTVGEGPNAGLIAGDGRLTGPLVNNATGEVLADAGKRVTFLTSATAASNSGKLTLQGGAIEFAGPLNNNASGRILGRGRLTSLQLNNSGTVSFSAGLSDVFGPVINNSGSPDHQ